MSENEVIAFAEEFFKHKGLTVASAYQSIPEWDSVNHLRFTMELEQKFGVSYRLEKIPFLLTLGDFIREANK